MSKGQWAMGEGQWAMENGTWAKGVAGNRHMVIGGMDIGGITFFFPPAHEHWLRGNEQG